jgi:cytochrome c
MNGRFVWIGGAIICLTSLLSGRAYLLGDAVAMAQPAGQADPVQGKEVFEKRCTGCHALEQDREGPRLRGVFGRTSGTVVGFPYSPALTKARIVWDELSLEQWLTDPDTLVPGNNMGFHVAKAEERRDVIAFLKQQSP